MKLRLLWRAMDLVGVVVGTLYLLCVPFCLAAGIYIGLKGRVGGIKAVLQEFVIPFVFATLGGISGTSALLIVAVMPMSIIHSSKSLRTVISIGLILGIPSAFYYVVYPGLLQLPLLFSRPLLDLFYFSTFVFMIISAAGHLRDLYRIGKDSQVQ